MKRVILFLLSVVCLGVEAVCGQTVRMRDVFAEMPDSIFPLITKNNRLDCIDFKESNMPALVKNVVEEPIELTALTDNYLKLKMSEVSDAEMKQFVLNDTMQMICLVCTYKGPIADSSIRFYNSRWQLVTGLDVKCPEVEMFIEEVGEQDKAMRDAVIAMLQEMPFVTATLHAENHMLTFALQTGELTKKEREWANNHLKTIDIDLEKSNERIIKL